MPRPSALPALVLAGLLGWTAPPARADDAPPQGARTAPELPAGQQADEGSPVPLLDLFTLRSASIVQRLAPFRSPYEGDNSLPAHGQTRFTHSAVLGLGKRFSDRLQGVLDLRWLVGRGIGDENGLASYVNNDFTMGARAAGPYVLRAFLRGMHPLGGDEHRAVDSDEDRIGGREPAERIEWKAGRLLPVDDFDKLRYASNALTEFVNLGLVNNPAWDNAQNARGTTDGLVGALVRRRWELRAGTYRMPRTPNGPRLDPDWARARNDNLELTLKAADSADDGPVLRVLAFRNGARMGRYRAALAAAQAGGGQAGGGQAGGGQAGGGQAGGAQDRVAAPSADVTSALEADRAAGRVKRGFTFNLEWPLADDGETGLFACGGWNDGRTEDFSFTEADRNLCAGGQLSGKRFGRAHDRVGLAVLVSGISAAHRDYLAAGGLGFQLGDGRLRYGRERLIEAYWRIQLNKTVALTPDVQWIANPGFNAERGPARVFSLRLVMTL